MPIHIVTDSTCDLPQELIVQYGISVVPLYINIGGNSYKDGVEMSRQQFYEGLPGFNPFPTTSAPSPGMFAETYKRLAAQGATEILSIHISPTLSATVNAARLGAQAVPDIKVNAFDSRQLSLGTGRLALLAAELASAGCAMDEIVAALKDQILRTHVWAVLNTLEFIHRSGRVGWLVYGLGSLLSLKPILKMHNGQSSTERVRTHKRGIERIITLLREVGPLERLDVMHIRAQAEAEILRQRAQDLHPPDSPPLIAEINPVIGAHIGPGSLGFVCVAQKR